MKKLSGHVKLQLKTFFGQKEMACLIYTPSKAELDRLGRSRVSPEVLEIISGTPLEFKDPVPIESQAQAKDYLHKKIEKYRDNLPYKESICIVEDKYIADTMNRLLAAGFTYVNMYARTHEFLVEPYIAGALAFNALNRIVDTPDEADLQYGITYQLAGFERL